MITKNNVITLILKHPTAFPWKRYMDINKEQLIKILEETNLDSNLKRSKAIWEIDKNICIESLKLQNQTEILNNVLKNLKDKPYAIASVIEDRQKILDLDTLKLIMKKKYPEKVTRNILEWVITLVSFGFIKNKKYTDSNSLSNLCSNILENKMKYSKKSFINDLNLILRRKAFSIEDAFNEFKNNYTDVSEEIEEEVESFFSDVIAKDNTINNEKVNMKEKIDKNIKSGIDSWNLGLDFSSDIESDLEKSLMGILENSKTEDIPEDENEIDLTDSVNEELSKTDKNIKVLEEDRNLIELLKSLTNIDNGSILSEMFNMYQNIQDYSKDNIEAILNNFFNELLLKGISPSNPEDIGKEIEVNTNDALKKFRFSKKVSTKGNVKGTVKYPEWNYKDHRIVPIIIEPEE